MRATSLLLVVAAASAACGPAADDGRIKIGGGGPGGGGGVGGGNGPDGGLGPDGNTILSGVVCETTLDAPTVCNTNAGAGLTVSDVLLSGVSATTDASSAFTLDLGSETVAILDVEPGTSGTTAPSIVAVNAGDTVVNVPVVDSVAFENLEDQLGDSVGDSTGVVSLTFVDQSGAGITGLTVTPPDGTVGTYYFDQTNGWTTGTSTGTSGIALVLGAAPGTINLPFANSAGTTTGTLSSVTVAAGHVTFAGVQLVQQGQ